MFVMPVLGMLVTDPALLCLSEKRITKRKMKRKGYLLQHGGGERLS